MDRVTSEFLSEDAGEVDWGAGKVAWRAVGSMKPAVPRRGQRIPKGGTWFGRRRAGSFDKQTISPRMSWLDRQRDRLIARKVLSSPGTRKDRRGPMIFRNPYWYSWRES